METKTKSSLKRKKSSSKTHVVKLMSFKVTGNLVSDKKGHSTMVLDFGEFQKKLEDFEDAQDLKSIANRKKDMLVSHDDFRKCLKSHDLL